MQLHNLKRNTANKKSARVGRGGKRGKTSGRGTKGQKARSGHKLRPEIRDTIKSIHKRRGYGINRTRTVNASVLKPETVNVSVLETVCENGMTVNPAFLLEKRLVRRQKGRTPEVKILAKGDITKKIIVEGCLMSLGAKTKIEAVGGTVK
ncbi:MAG: 50S ribosomal protein L15 [Candidatus Yonathbacteria bacterium]|nr:50S ribosomal protein L15 [Candidatus Yonathbacteria bacterium]NTW47511.1 50S ribosomal protein L15 [Candidatus Yonathbacteria bacterium]